MDKETENWFSNLEYDINEKRNNEFFLLIKQMLVLSTTLLGLIVALHKNVPNHAYSNTLLIATIFSLGLNILLALAILHGKVRNLDIFHQKVKDKQQEMGEKKNTSKEIFAPFGKSFDRLTNIFYVSFALSVLLLCLYGSLSLTSVKQESQEIQNKTELTE